MLIIGCSDSVEVVSTFCSSIVVGREVMLPASGTSDVLDVLDILDVLDVLVEVEGIDGF
jgi:hypothetical protein